MIIIRSSIFNRFNNIIFGFSTKVGLNRVAPFYWNMSFSIGDNDENVTENRIAFFNELGLTDKEVAFQKQVHSDKIMSVANPGINGESDALITTKKGLGLAISSADCAAIFIYDQQNKLIAAVHSGWRGTAQKILHKTLSILSVRYTSKPENLFAYIAPSISQKNYEVGKEVAVKFDSKYIRAVGNKFYLNVAAANYDMLIKFGIPRLNIQRSNLCSYALDNLLHSYRLGGNESGRALGVIAMKE